MKKKIYWSIKLDNAKIVNTKTREEFIDEFNLYYTVADNNNFYLNVPIIDDPKDFNIVDENGNEECLFDYMKETFDDCKYLLVTHENVPVMFTDFFIPSDDGFYCCQLNKPTFNLLLCYGLNNFKICRNLYQHNIYRFSTKLYEEKLRPSLLFFLYSENKQIQKKINELQLVELKKNLRSKFESVCQGTYLIRIGENAANLCLSEISNTLDKNIPLINGTLVSEDKNIEDALSKRINKLRQMHEIYLNSFYKYLDTLFANDNFSLVLNQDKIPYFLYYGFTNTEILNNIISMEVK